jgi:hypothetical protein
MNHIRPMLAMLLTALVMALVPVTALAAPGLQADDDTADPQGGLTCSDGVCSLSVDLDAIDERVSTSALQLASGILTVAEQNISAIPSGTDLEVNDRVTLSLPVGNIEMFNADLDVERDDEGQIERFYGTASIPLPTLGILGDLQLIAPGEAVVAYDTGESLAHLGAPLDPERRYLAMHFGSGNERAVTDPAFSFTGEEGQNSLVLIVDPAERFVHAVGNVMLVDTAQLLTEEVASVIGATGVEGLVPAAGLLPLPEQLGLRLALLVTDDLSESEFELSGGYAVSGGPLAARFGLELEPVAFEGTFQASDDGVAMIGKARSAFQPGEVFGTEGTAAVHVPLLGSGERASLALGGKVDVPMFSFSEGKDVLLVMPELPADEALAAVRSQLADSSSSVRDGVEWVIVSAGERVGDGAALREGVEWAASSVERIDVDTAQVGEITHDGIRWATDFVGNATEFAVDSAGSGAAQVNSFWCNRLGRCDPEATAATE